MEYLQLIKEGHEKVMINVYNDMKNPQASITNRSITNLKKSIWFGLRSQSIRGIKMNFPNMYPENRLCPICERSQDTQEHVPLCNVMYFAHEEAYGLQSYRWTVEQQKEYVEVYKRYLELRAELIDPSNGSSLPGLHTGPVGPQAAHSGQTRGSSTDTEEG